MGKVVRNRRLSRMGEKAQNQIYGAGLAGPFKKGATMTVSLFSIILFIGAFVSTRWSNVEDVPLGKFGVIAVQLTKPPNKIFEYSLNCSDGNMAQSRPVPQLATFELSKPPTETCPEYFRWIYEDLRPWRETGITRDMVERAKPAAYIRVVVVDGKVFTIWGILQLLRTYPWKLPDFDLMFWCGVVA